MTGNRLPNHEWRDVRERALTRDGFSCQKCGSDDELHVHHIVPIEAGGSNDLDNLVTVCIGCHDALHKEGPSEDGRYDLSLIDGPRRREPQDGFRNANMEMTGCRARVVEYMMDRDSVTVKQLIENLDYTRSPIQDNLRWLRSAGIVTRVSRGEYRYIPETQETENIE